MAAVRIFDSTPSSFRATSAALKRRRTRKAPHEQPTAADGCSDMLREAIVSGELPTGIRLPPERRLAERFGVNRVTIRAALGKLEAEHLLTVRQGSGYVVTDYRRTGGLDLVTTLAAHAAETTDRLAIFRDLLMVRRHLARAVVERLIEDASERSLLEVEMAIDRFAKVTEADASLDDLARADLDVVAALVAATGSQVLQICFNPVAALVLRLPELAKAMYREPKSNVVAFRAVLDFVRKRNKSSVEMALALLAERDEATVRLIARARKSK